MITKFQIIPIHPRLAPYIERVFIIESSGRFPTADLKLIVPNACPKLVIPFRNGLSATSAEWEHISEENKLTFIGISDIAASVDFLQEGTAGSITVEFKPLGAYRFTHLNWGTVKNRVVDYTVVGNAAVRELEDKLLNQPDPVAKVQLVQRFLVEQLGAQAEDPIFEYCVQQITQSTGRTTIGELEQQTGYSARWLNMLFANRIGISPKNLSSIIRFQQYYHALVNNAEMFFLEKEFYNYYYDQSHFIKDFKRFTGNAPVLHSQLANSYDKVFYKG